MDFYTTPGLGGAGLKSLATALQDEFVEREQLAGLFGTFPGTTFMSNIRIGTVGIAGNIKAYFWLDDVHSVDIKSSLGEKVVWVSLKSGEKKKLGILARNNGEEGKLLEIYELNKNNPVEQVLKSRVEQTQTTTVTADVVESPAKKSSKSKSHTDLDPKIVQDIEQAVSSLDKRTQRIVTRHMKTCAGFVEQARHDGGDAAKKLLDLRVKLGEPLFGSKNQDVSPLMELCGSLENSGLVPQRWVPVGELKGIGRDKEKWLFFFSDRLVMGSADYLFSASSSFEIIQQGDDRRQKVYKGQTFTGGSALLFGKGGDIEETGLDERVFELVITDRDWDLSIQIEQGRSNFVTKLMKRLLKKFQSEAPAAVQSSPAQSGTVAAPTAPSLASQIAELGDLREMGVLSEEEFTQAKAKLLEG